MFEVGFTEILLISFLALIVLGPQRLPKLASQLGRWAGRARAMARQLREQLEQEVNLEETFNPRSYTQQTRNNEPLAAPPPSESVPDARAPEAVANTEQTSTPTEVQPPGQSADAQESLLPDPSESNNTGHADYSHSANDTVPAEPPHERGT